MTIYRFSHALFLFVVAVLLVTQGKVGKTAQPKSETRTQYALVIGVSQYEPRELRSLRYSDSDASTFAKSLRETQYNVKLLSTSEESEKKKDLPTVENIRTQLKDLVRKVKSNDDVILYFTGHAVQFRGDKLGPYLCPVDGSIADKKSLIALSEVADSLQISKARNMLLVLDIARTDPTANFARSASFLADIKSVTKPTTPRAGSFAVFVACRSGQNAFESEKLKAGVFTYFLTQGWNGKADIDGDHCITISELTLFVGKSVKKYTQQEFEPLLQIPEVSGVFDPSWCLRKLPTLEKK